MKAAAEGNDAETKRSSFIVGANVAANARKAAFIFQ